MQQKSNIIFCLLWACRKNPFIEHVAILLTLCLFRTIHPLVLDQNYINLKNQVIKAERRVLKELGFCVHVKHPHKVAIFLILVSVIVAQNCLMPKCFLLLFNSQPQQIEGCSCVNNERKKVYNEQGIIYLLL